jgi:hypothetical protein
MGRAGICAFAGGVIGFFAGCVIVRAMVGASPPSDTAAITLFVGTFLAGTGAIAGAISGGVAEFFRRAERARESRTERGSDFGA